MRPKSAPREPQQEMFQIELERLIDMNHPLIVLGQSIDWESFAVQLGASYHPTQGAPGISTRLMVALHYLKYQADQSDEEVVATWWKILTGSASAGSGTSSTGCRWIRRA